MFGNVSEISSRETGVMEELFLEILIDSNSEERERERERMVKKERINFATGKKQPIRRAKIRDSPMTMSNFMSFNPSCMSRVSNGDFLF